MLNGQYSGIGSEMYLPGMVHPQQLQPPQQQQLHVSSSFQGNATPPAPPPQMSIPSGSHPSINSSQPASPKVGGTQPLHPSTTSSSSQHWQVVQPMDRRASNGGGGAGGGQILSTSQLAPGGDNPANPRQSSSLLRGSSFSTESSSLDRTAGSQILNAHLNGGYSVPNVIVGSSHSSSGRGRLLNGPPAQQQGGGAAAAAFPQQSVSCSVGSLGHTNMNLPHSASVSGPLYPWSAQTNESISSQVLTSNTATFAASEPHSQGVYGTSLVGMSHGSFGTTANDAIGGPRLLFPNQITPIITDTTNYIPQHQPQQPQYLVDMSQFHNQQQQMVGGAPYWVSQQQHIQYQPHIQQQQHGIHYGSPAAPQYVHPSTVGGATMMQQQQQQPPQYFAMTSSSQLQSGMQTPQMYAGQHPQQRRAPTKSSQVPRTPTNTNATTRAPGGGGGAGDAQKGPYLLPDGSKPSVVFSVILMELPEMLEVRTPPTDQQQEFDGALYFSYKNIPQETLLKASSAEQFKRLSDTLQKYFDLQREQPSTIPSSPTGTSTVPASPNTNQPSSPLATTSTASQEFPPEQVVVLAVHPFDRGHKNRGMARVVLNRLPHTWVGKVKIADATGAGMSPSMVAKHAFGPASAERAHEEGVDCIPLLVLDPTSLQLHFALEEGKSGAYNLTDGPVTGISAAMPGSKLLTHRFHVDRGSPAFPGRFVRAGENVKAVLNK